MGEISPNESLFLNASTVLNAESGQQAPTSWESAFEWGEHRSPTYRGLRSILPVPVFASLWVMLFHASDGRANNILQMSFSLRHFLYLILVVALWNLIVNVRAPHIQKSLLSIEFRKIVQGTLVCALAILSFELPRTDVKVALVTFALAIVTLLSSSLSLLCTTCVIRSALLSRSKQLVIIVGSGVRGQRAVNYLRRSRRYEILGIIDDTPVTEHDLYIGTTDKLADLLKHHPVEAVFITLPIKTQYDQIRKVITISESVGIQIHHVANIFSVDTEDESEDPFKSPQYTVLRAPHFDVRAYVKRGIDITVASVALLCASPVMLAIAVAISLSDKGPVLFTQQRYGKNRKRFSMYKFRTMVVDAEARLAALEVHNETGGATFKMKNDPRVTAVGRFLRKTSLDELPQLFNVLKGDMSLVGPRPLPVRDVSLFEEPWLLRRFSVTPGLTCLWQISGRSNTTFDSWMRQDLDYIDRWSLWLDCSILLKTIPAVLRGSGAM